MNGDVECSHSNIVHMYNLLRISRHYGTMVQDIFDIFNCVKMFYTAQGKQSCINKILCLHRAENNMVFKLTHKIQNIIKQKQKRGESFC